MRPVKSHQDKKQTGKLKKYVQIPKDCQNGFVISVPDHLKMPEKAQPPMPSLCMNNAAVGPGRRPPGVWVPSPETVRRASGATVQHRLHKRITWATPRPSPGCLIWAWHWCWLWFDNGQKLQPLQKTVWRGPRKLRLEQIYDPAIPLLGIYWKKKKTLIQKDTCTPMFIAIAKIWKQPKCPLTGEWTEKA